MARRRRGRAKWYAGGGLILLLVLLLGDRFGTFRSRADGVVTGRQPVRPGPVTAPPRPPAGDPAPGTAAPPPRPQPDAELAAGRGAVDAAPATTAGEPGAAADEAARQAVSTDRMVGMIDGYEQALAEDRLVALAQLVEHHRKQVIRPPAALAERWQAVQARVVTALEVGPRLRTMVRAGEILAVQRWLTPLLADDAPAWLRERVDAAATAAGWPSLTRRWQVVAGAGTPTVLEQQRRVRFLKDGALQEGRLMRCTAESAIVRVQGLGGFTYPVVPRHLVEPVHPSPPEALGQGVAAARAGDPTGVVLWASYFRAHGDRTGAERLQALLKSP